MSQVDRPVDLTQPDPRDTSRYATYPADYIARPDEMDTLSCRAQDQYSNRRVGRYSPWIAGFLSGDTLITYLVAPFAGNAPGLIYGNSPLLHIYNSPKS